MRNKFEEDIYKKLVRKYGKANVEYEPDQFKYVIPYIYTPDFRVVTHGDEDSLYRFYIETKGYFRPEDRRTIKAVVEQNPELDLRMIFQRDQRLAKNAKSTYSDWAQRNEINYGISTVPRSW